MSEERSAAGNRILRHQERSAVPDDGIAHADNARLSEHIERIFGRSGPVFHEIVSDRIHVDVLTFPPNERHPFRLLVTSGMSARPMNVPDTIESPEKWRHAELCILLPPEWPLGEEALRDEKNYWPIRLIKSLARLPHDYGTWLGWGHSIPNGDPATPYAKDSLLSSAVLIPPYLLGAEFFTVAGEPPLRIYQVLPVTSREMELKLELGLEGLLDRIEALKAGVYGPIDPGRSSLR